MVGIGSEKLFCSSYGWFKHDGKTYRRFSVRWRDELKCFIDYPWDERTEGEDRLANVLILASYMSEMWDVG